jgi:hypothetical protein
MLEGFRQEPRVLQSETTAWAARFLVGQGFESSETAVVQLAEVTGTSWQRALKRQARKLFPNRWRIRVKRSVRGLTSFTGCLRGLPHAVVIGVQKGGSSSLFYYLQQHPQVLLPLNVIKEVHYFDDFYSRGINFYRSHFPLTWSMRRRSRQLGMPVITCEATPEYIVHPRAPERIAADLPDARFLVVLRDPIRRAISSYKMQVKRTVEQRSLEQAFQDELARPPLDYTKLSEEDLKSSSRTMTFDYLSRGRYIDQLLRWEQAVGRDRIQVLVSEEMFLQTARAFAEVCNFLGLQPASHIQFENINPNAREATLSTETASALEEYYRDCNSRLFDWLGRKLPWEGTVQSALPSAQTQSVSPVS